MGSVIRNRKPVILAAKKLRLKGLSHRQISRILGIGLGSAVIFTKEINLTPDQHNKLMKNTGIFRYPKEQKAKWSSVGSNNWLSRIRHTRDGLLEEIKNFYKANGRIPSKREFYSHWQAFYRVFGKWNNAIKEAGFTPNTEKFTHKYVARDGHICDSLSEKIIDNWLSSKKLPHEHGAYYPGQTKFKSDFVVNNKFWIEFPGLLGQLGSYDKLYQQKRKLAFRLGMKIIEIAPSDIFPKNQLDTKLGFLLQSKL